MPHSEISGSKVVCTSPKLIAAYHVLHRLSVPRHPPSALSSFFTLFTDIISYVRCFNGILVYPIQMSKIAAIISLLYIHSGGDDRARTGDPRLAKPVLSQLSYIPMKDLCQYQMVGLTRVELVTSRLSGVRSNQLSYRPTHSLNFRSSRSLCKEEETTFKTNRAQPCIMVNFRLPLYTP